PQESASNKTIEQSLIGAKTFRSLNQNPTQRSLENFYTFAFPGKHFHPQNIKHCEGNSGHEYYGYNFHNLRFCFVKLK
ncbi:hypothetical protein, partial [Chryseobacterium mucoviscidosis]|uniref:hypothetical protein n=1 Tax=Chryseobacterium mucoviscidosis TaxID=1945581 RepID=UPI001E334560